MCKGKCSSISSYRRQTAVGMLTLLCIALVLPSLLAFHAKNPWVRASTELRASVLSELAEMTTISIDSGDLDVLSRWSATGLITDATTNPLFVSQAGQNGDARYDDMVIDALTYAKEVTCIEEGCSAPEETMAFAIDRLAVNLGVAISKLVNGKVSTEVDIRLSYDKEGSIARARKIIEMYAQLGVPKERILIKLAGTWEGIQAARELEKEGIECNITLVFGFTQAVAAAQAGAYLISPFPGRILDWHKKQSGKTGYAPAADPGVLACQRMYSFFRKYEYKTICMPASWRPSRGADVTGSATDEIVALAGIDEMTIPPGLLEALESQTGPLERQCAVDTASATCTDANIHITETLFKELMAADGCATAKLKEGIDAFTAETEKLEQVLIGRFS